MHPQPITGEHELPAEARSLRFVRRPKKRSKLARAEHAVFLAVALACFALWAKRAHHHAPQQHTSCEAR